ncbi:hypothetical protein ABWL39_15210 [Chitinivorax sp. PXF-14]|uniref:hypothetical protein n=1 Tax=Chitinivorax sp. PXF-14 TaxID=3230488 RepID=UPI003467E9A5
MLRILFLCLCLPLAWLNGCAVVTATAAVASTAVSVGVTAASVATDVAVGTVKGAAKVTGAAIDAASSQGADAAPVPPDAAQ